jgi:hypothetical protein
MEKTEPVPCVLCGDSAAETPRIHVRQEHELDSPVAHRLAICGKHGEELRVGAITPQHIIYTWATHADPGLYRGERLVLRPELRCLACNTSLGHGDGAPEAQVAELRCRKCSAMNAVGSALGHPVAVRLLQRAPS